MKRILTTLLLVASLSGVIVGAEEVNPTLRTEADNSTSHNLNSALIQRWSRRRWRRRRNRRWVRVHWNNGRRVGRRWENRRGRRRGRAIGHQM
ncbi:MAG TPA: hypothetical protein VGC87_03415 [Pyrinomonadaceae bacterium]|jgi:hypothetical protein